jgi:hypothetical protein
MMRSTKAAGGWVLLALQVVLVLSIAAKYVYERETRPRVWVRTTQFDPNEPLRGRYLALQLVVDSCGLPSDKRFYQKWSKDDGRYNWSVRLEAKNGKLVPVLVLLPSGMEATQSLGRMNHQSCDRAMLQNQLPYFIPEHAKSPFPLKNGEQLWTEVTVPEQGPPRPIQLAVSGPEGWRILRLERN